MKIETLKERLSNLTDPRRQYGNIRHNRHPEMTNKWNREFWARGYYVTTVGNVNEETVKKYIKEQEDESQKEDMHI